MAVAGAECNTAQMHQLLIYKGRQKHFNNPPHQRRLTHHPLAMHRSRFIQVLKLYNSDLAKAHLEHPTHQCNGSPKSQSSQ
ncbi:hypothetical protein D3C77_684860 [compost metagenome]